MPGGLSHAVCAGSFFAAHGDLTNLTAPQMQNDAKNQESCEIDRPYRNNSNDRTKVYRKICVHRFCRLLTAARKQCKALQFQTPATLRIGWKQKITYLERSAGQYR